MPVFGWVLSVGLFLEVDQQGSRCYIRRPSYSPREVAAAWRLARSSNCLKSVLLLFRQFQALYQFLLHLQIILLKEM